MPLITMNDRTVFEQAGTPEWWFNRLYAELKDPKRVARLKLLKSYYEGEPDRTGRWNVEGAAYEAYRTIIEDSYTNFAARVIASAVERIRIRAISLSTSDDVSGNAGAWGIWNANDLPIYSDDLTRDMCAYGEGIAMITAPAEDDELDAPVISIEDPEIMYVEHDPVRKQKLLAALKMWYDPVQNANIAYLFLPGELHVAQMDMGAGVELAPPTNGNWNWDTDLGTTWDTNDIPVVHFVNEDGVGDFERHLPVLDRIDAGTFRRDSLALLQAFKQKAIIGGADSDIENADGDLAEDDIKALELNPASIWLLPQASQVWESSATDISPLQNAKNADIKDLAAVTATPMFIFAPDTANQSAEGASLQREELVYRVDKRITRLKVGWKRVMQFALRLAVQNNSKRFIAGLPQSGLSSDELLDALDQLEVHFLPVEKYSLAEKGSAAAQLASILPWETLLSEVLQLSPEQIVTAKAQRTQDAQYNSTLLAQQLALTLASQPATDPATAKPADPATPTATPAADPSTDSGLKLAVVPHVVFPPGGIGDAKVTPKVTFSAPTPPTTPKAAGDDGTGDPNPQKASPVPLSAQEHQQFLDAGHTPQNVAHPIPHDQVPLPPDKPAPAKAPAIPKGNSRPTSKKPTK